MTKAAIKQLFEKAKKRTEEERNDPKGSPFERSILKLLHQVKSNKPSREALEYYLGLELYDMYFPSNLGFYEIINKILLFSKYATEKDGIIELTISGEEEYARLSSKEYYMGNDFLKTK